MAQTLVLLYLTSILAVGKGELIDFHAINKRQTATDGERDCQALGYDGLAVVSSPETYRYALRLTETLRSRAYGVYVGLQNRSDTYHVTWDDGTFPAADTPWLNADELTDFPSNHHGRITDQGLLRSVSGEPLRYSLCGVHSNNPTEGHGVTVLGHQPAGVSSTLSVNKVMSYLECVLLCGQDHRCRAAEFNFDLLTCVTLGPGSHSGLTPNPQSQTFVRNGFP